MSLYRSTHEQRFGQGAVNYQSFGPDGSTSGSMPAVSTSYERYKDWTVSPGYFAVQRSARSKSSSRHKGLTTLPVNSFGIYEYKRNHPQGVYFDERYDAFGATTHKNTYTGFVKPYDYIQRAQLPSGLVTDRMRTIALEKSDLLILEKVKDIKVNLAQVVAERNQTLGLAANLFNKLARIADYVGATRKGRLDRILELNKQIVRNEARKRRIKAYNKRAEVNSVTHERRTGKIIHRKTGGSNNNSSLRRAIKNLSDDAIAVQYGIRPLLSDIKGLFELSSGQKLFRSRANSRIKVSNSAFESYTLYGVTYVITTTEELEISQVVRYHSQFNGFDLISTLGLSNPFYIGWELTPWSFAVDWFLPIGRSINVLDATVGLSLERGSKVVKSTITTTVSGFRDAGPPVKSAGRYGFSISENETVTRLSRASVGFPNVPLPSFKNPLSPEHAFNAVALAGQRLRGGHR